ncbi:MAG: hypothetical protein JWP97_2758 [Labilithrix sp.]|nr:hypothetical protein [Labilithrix sp.]
MPTDGPKGKLPPVAPPPLPTSSKRMPVADRAAPQPSPEGFMTTAGKMSLADIALALRDEQLEAKVVHYKAELATSPELDAVTQQVIEELQGLQAAARAKGPVSRPPPTQDRAQLEIELIQTLKEMLGRIFRPGKLATIMERKLGEVSKRFARTFFASELHDRIRGSVDEVKAMRFADQALYHAFVRAQDDVLAQLDGFQYAQDAVRDRAKEQFYAIVKELRNDFLARTTPELNTLIKFLNEVLAQFFTVELPPMLGELSWEVVKEARLADARTGASYKISASAFPTFRIAFERRFLQRLVPFVEDEMLTRVRESLGEFRSETLQFVADPSIFSDMCEIVCECIYDMLYNDGFLDLPSDWRARLTAGTD